MQPNCPVPFCPQISRIQPARRVLHSHSSGGEEIWMVLAHLSVMAPRLSVCDKNTPIDTEF
jgi:hypothetical protein